MIWSKEYDLRGRNYFSIIIRKRQLHQTTTKMEHKDSKLDTVPEKKHNNNQNTRPRINREGI